MKKFIRTLTTAIVAALAVTFLASCEDNDKEHEKLITFHIASAKNVTVGFSRSMITLPLSGLTLVVNNDPFMYSGDLTRVDVAKVIMPDGSPLLGFYFDCNENGMKKLYTHSASNTGAYIVMLYEGAPVGVRNIETPIEDGKLFIVPELPPDVDLQKKVDDMNLSIEAIGKIVEEKKKSQDELF